MCNDLKKAKLIKYSSETEMLCLELKTNIVTAIIREGIQYAIFFISWANFAFCK